MPVSALQACHCNAILDCIGGTGLPVEIHALQLLLNSILISLRISFFDIFSVVAATRIATSPASLDPPQNIQNQITFAIMIMKAIALRQLSFRESSILVTAIFT